MKLPGLVPVLVCAINVTACCAEELGVDPDTSARQQADIEKAKGESLRQAKWTIAVDVEMVQVPQKQALEVLPALRSDDPKKVETAVAQIQQLISKGEAKLMGWPLVTTRDGQRANAEGIREERFPDQFDTPQAPQNVGGSVKPAETMTLTPTTFETRNAGTNLEVEPRVLADNKHIALLELVTHRVELVAMKSFGTGRSKQGAEVNIEQPVFHTFRVSGDPIVTNGQPTLIAVHLISDKAPVLEFFIARAVATKIE